MKPSSLCHGFVLWAIVLLEGALSSSLSLWPMFSSFRPNLWYIYYFSSNYPHFHDVIFVISKLLPVIVFRKFCLRFVTPWCSLSKAVFFTQVFFVEVQPKCNSWWYQLKTPGVWYLSHNRIFWTVLFNSFSYCLRPGYFYTVSNLANLLVTGYTYCRY